MTYILSENDRFLKGNLKFEKKKVLFIYFSYFILLFWFNSSCLYFPSLKSQD